MEHGFPASSGLWLHSAPFSPHRICLDFSKEFHSNDKLTFTGINSLYALHEKQLSKIDSFVFVVFLCFHSALIASHLSHQWWMLLKCAYQVKEIVGHINLNLLTLLFCIFSKNIFKVKICICVVLETMNINKLWWSTE